ncbi:MAG: MGMT family protein [Phycisphaerae bacterium]|nr:MGMT family protein [Phycisphaerae bacterium]
MSIKIIDTSFSIDKPCQYRIFKTSGFTVATILYNEVVVGLKFGSNTIDQEICAEYISAKPTNKVGQELTLQLEAYFKGNKINFDCMIDLWWASDFSRKVLVNCINVDYGKTISYGQLASSACSPKAARAVGSVMANNHIPIIIPCHRVLRSDGTIGQYSAAQGSTTKQKLLTMETLK